MKQALGKRRFDHVLNAVADTPRTAVVLATQRGKIRTDLLADLQLQAAQRGPLHHLPQLSPCDLGKVVLREWTEGRDAVDTPQKLRRERLPKNSFCPVLRAAGREADTVFHRFSASQIGGHDDHGVLEVHRPAERIRQNAVL